MSDEQPPETRLELYVRSLLPRGACACQEEVVDRLQELADEGAIEAFEVTVWGRGIAPATAGATDAGRDLLERIEQFSGWARERGLTLRPRFERRTVSSDLTHETYDAVLFPAMAVAVFRDDDLAFVAPCADGTTVYTVADVLDAVEDGAFDTGGNRPGEGSARTVREAAASDG